MSSSLFRDITQHRLVVTDVSGQPIGPIFNGKAVQEEIRQLTTNVRCVTSQKSYGLIYKILRPISFDTTRTAASEWRQRAAPGIIRLK